MVKLEDALRHPIISKFLIPLMQLPAGFPVLRTSGQIQSGWVINKGEIQNEEFIRMHDGEWKVPVIWLSPDDDSSKSMIKYTPIANFKLPEMYDQIKPNLPSDFIQFLDESLIVLIEGFYTEDFEEVQRIRAHDGQEHYPNIPQAENVLYEGRVVQVMRVPTAASSAAKATTAATDDPTTEPSCETK